MRYLLILLFFVFGCGIHKDFVNNKGPNKKESALLHPNRIDNVEWIETPNNFMQKNENEYNKLSFNKTKHIEILNGKYLVGLSLALVSSNDSKNDYYAYYLEIIQPIKYKDLIVEEFLIELKYIDSETLNQPLEKIIEYDDIDKTLEFNLGKSTFKCKLILEDDYNYSRYKK